ncbi:MAG: M48 family metallopeptidase [Okeania sp. SIO3I5]|uniref:M48 family metallopeptidase n=1 Tax=Okeania sp. SIO3I5 TaxID=2607805 RepID=UPI0013BAB828|nr:M48 family metallopeptidase [Okeania sp. SIO3I5]NEQ35912.1 M48 family metallopeptidase [Okeania sp. SIO3I5]
MAIKYSDHKFISFQEYIQDTERGKIIPYGHPMDEWIIRTLNSNIAKPLIEKAIDFLVSVKFGADLISMVPINSKSYPELFQILHHCAKTLAIPIPHTVLKQDINITYSAGTDSYVFIYVSPDLLQSFSTPEANFVIGCECGHIATGQILYRTLVSFLTGVYEDIQPFGLPVDTLLKVAGVALMAWSRRSELTADRAGLICCSDINIAETALLKIATGMADIKQIDIDRYLSQSEAMEEYLYPAKLNSIVKSQLSIPKRIKALRLFANSELYYKLINLPEPHGQNLLSREELDRQVNQLIQL